MSKSNVSAFLCCIALLMAGCSQDQQSAQLAQDTGPKQAEAPKTKPEPAPEPRPQPVPFPELMRDKMAGLPKVEMEIKGKGKIVMTLAPELAPKTCEQILRLTKEKFYDGQTVHRVEDWVVQWGDPQSKNPDKATAPIGTGGSGKQLPFESNSIAMTRGVVAMASTGTKVGGDSQIFILKKNMPMLFDNYAAFGYVTEGMGVVDALEQNDKIVRMTVIK